MINTYSLRAKLFDLTYTLVNSILYIILLALLSAFTWLTYYLLSLTLGSLFEPQYLAIFSAVLIIVLFSLLKIPLISRIKRKVFGYLSDPSELFQKIDHLIATEMNIILLEKKLVELMTTDLRASFARFVLVSDFVAKPPNTLAPPDPTAEKFKLLENKLHHYKQIMLKEQLTDKADLEIFNSLNISLIIPLAVGDEDIGLLILGPKQNNGIYHRLDLRLFAQLIPKLGVALKNADSYRKIQDFSRTLETKVIERTHQLQESQAAQLKLKDEFVFIATHDLATPVTAIAGFISLINQQKTAIPQEITNYIKAISEASERLKVLVNDLLQIARSDSGTIKVELSKLDATELLQAAIRQIEPQANAKQIKIVTQLSPDNNLQGDSKKLSEVFENLLSNAIKYNKPGGDLTISSKVDGDKLVFEFRDTGIGIPQAEHSKVFTKFFRSESAQARQQPGSGLGLFVVRMLTEKMGGTISFDSKEGQGTTFVLHFRR